MVPPSGRSLMTVVVMLIAGLVAYLPLMPPAAVPDSGDLQAFSAERAMEHVRVIAAEPHPMGSDANRQVRAHLEDELTQLGISLQVQSFMAPDIFGSAPSVELANVIGRIPGTASTGSIVLVAHYDSESTTPGANDNAAAVAALLETGRALNAGEPLVNDIVLLFTDGEEPYPRYGSPVFVDDPRFLRDTMLVVNFEAAGGSGPSLLAETNGPSSWLMKGLQAADSRPAAFSFITETTALFGDFGTDFDPFRNKGIAGMHFAYMRDSPIYHTAADSIEGLGLNSLQHHGEHAMAISSHFGMLNLSDIEPSSNTTFFSIGFWDLHYPSWVNLVVLVIAGAGLGVLWRRHSSGSRGLGRRARGSAGRRIASRHPGMGGYRVDPTHARCGRGVHVPGSGDGARRMLGWAVLARHWERFRSPASNRHDRLVVRR